MKTLELDIQSLTKKLAKEIYSSYHQALSNVLFVGIVTRGYPLALRLSAILLSEYKLKIEVAKLDVTPYRDDLYMKGSAPLLEENILPNSLENTTIVLIDDVLFHGRTARAAIEAILAYGRPKKIELAVLIDRGHREIPITANYIGTCIETKESDKIAVHMSEIDGKDGVVINE